MSLGDVKPPSLRKIESLIWKDLYLVARCQLSAEDMMEHVLGTVVRPERQASFRLNKAKLREYLREKYQPIRDHTGFFFPGEFNSFTIVLSSDETI